MQVEAISNVVNCRQIVVWGRSHNGLEAYQHEMRNKGFEISTTQDPDEATYKAQLIITTTPAEQPILDLAHVHPGTHIIAMGSDTEQNNELTLGLLARADVYVTDSLEQCATCGEWHHALNAGVRAKTATVELGKIISDPRLDRAYSLASLA